MISLPLTILNDMPDNLQKALDSLAFSLSMCRDDSLRYALDFQVLYASLVSFRKPGRFPWNPPQYCSIPQKALKTFPAQKNWLVVLRTELPG